MSVTNENYLRKVLQEQELDDNGSEIRGLEQIRDDVERLLRRNFGARPALHEGGSKAKGTMIREAHDLDLPYYFPRDDGSAGDTIEEIYESVEEALGSEYQTERKGVAIRLLDCHEATDRHTDVIPGRYVYGSGGDAFLYPSSSDKMRLQTNLDTHVRHVKDSGVTDAIRLQKLWRTRRGIRVKTFALELLTIDLLKRRKSWGVCDQMTHVWTEFRDNMENLYIEDPANSNNDLSGMLSAQVRAKLSAEAAETLGTIEEEGWQAVFGDVSGDSDAAVEALLRIALSTPGPAKPWSRG